MMQDSIYSIRGGGLSASIRGMGAELCSLQDAAGQEYLWQGDARYWAGQAPLLFPIAGRLKDGQYSFQGQRYAMPAHGFAKGKPFRVEHQDAHSISLVLEADADTLACYPFPFRLRCCYTLADGHLLIHREVENPEDAPLWFSMGEHLGFATDPFGSRLEDCELVFPSPQTADNLLVNEQGLLSGRQAYLQQEERIALDRQVFQALGSLLLEGLDAPWVALRGKDKPRGLRVGIAGFPVLVLWTPAKGGNFICIEPWHGLPDPANGHEGLPHKPGILQLAAGERFSYQLSITLE